eukprot:TRINITY_DN4157_c0_g3_i1.p1 TRINITY_DN4157_c0_g3~~TRINITY_DN4157_c0_g3_i1.p1  ORF type:complete len:351 (+),score=115.86 TRINITY_DN4157_c0_g3_i1:80-1132(+)
MKSFIDEDLKDYENAERLAESSLGESDVESLLMSLARGAEYPSQCSSNESHDDACYYHVGELYFEDEIPDMVCDKLDVVFSDLLNNGTTFEETHHEIEQVLLEYPQTDLSSWMRLTSIEFQRYLHNHLNNRKQLLPIPPPPKRLVHRRGFTVGMIETSSDELNYNSDSDEDENPVVLREAGSWLEVECTKGIYYFNNDDGTSQWSIVGTAFLQQDDIDEEQPEQQQQQQQQQVTTLNDEDIQPTESQQSETKEAVPEDLAGLSKKKRWKKKNPEKVREMRKAQKKRRKERRASASAVAAEEADDGTKFTQETVDLIAAKISELQLELQSFERRSSDATTTTETDRMMRLM